MKIFAPFALLLAMTSLACTSADGEDVTGQADEAITADRAVTLFEAGRLIRIAKIDGTSGWDMDEAAAKALTPAELLATNQTFQSGRFDISKNPGTKVAERMSLCSDPGEKEFRCEVTDTYFKKGNRYYVRSFVYTTGTPFYASEDWFLVLDVKTAKELPSELLSGEKTSAEHNAFLPLAQKLLNDPSSLAPATREIMGETKTSEGTWISLYSTVLYFPKAGDPVSVSLIRECATGKQFDGVKCQTL